MAFLVNDLRLSDRRDILKDILESAVPITFQDVVVTFCTVTGWRKGQLVQISDARKIYQRSIDGEPWSAIQITTAAGMLVGIPALALYHYFRGRIDRFVFEMEEVSFQLVEELSFEAMRTKSAPKPEKKVGTSAPMKTG